MVKTVQVASVNLLDPAQDFGLGLFLGEGHLEDGCELFSQPVGLLSRSRILEETSQDFAFFFVEVLGIFAKGSKTTVELLIFCFGQFFLQTQQLLLSDLVCSLTIVLGNMKAVHHNSHSRDFFPHRFRIGFPQITTHRLHTLQNTWWDRAEKLYYIGFFMSGQDT